MAMTNLADILVTTDHQIADQVFGNGEYNRIKLRQESFQNACDKIMNFVVRDSQSSINVPISKLPIVEDNNLDVELYDSIRDSQMNTLDSVSNLGGSVAKPLNLKQDKLEMLINRVSKNVPNDELAIDEITRIVEQNVMPINEDDRFVNNSENVNPEKIDEVYENFNHETEATLAVKTEAEEAQTRFVQVEQQIKEEMERSNHKLQEKSTEHAAIQAKKEYALKRKAKIDNDIVEAFTRQRNLLLQAKQRYTKIIEDVRQRENRLREEARLHTEENESKIVQFQQNIERDNSAITMIEEENARKEAILAALSSPLELDIMSPVASEQFGFEDSASQSYRKAV